VSGWLEAEAPAKLNLALVVGPRRDDGDGRHEVLTVLQRVSLADTVAVRRATSTTVAGFEDDTLVRAALEAVSAATHGEIGFEARIEKRIPVAAGLGGGSSDAAAALRLANELVDFRLSKEKMHVLAAGLGADVPFFLRAGPQLGSGDGTTLEPIELPSDYVVVLARRAGAVKESTAAVYDDFDARGGENGFDERSRALMAALELVATAGDLARLPGNDLASSPLAVELRGLGAFRAEITGAGPVVYGLFTDEADARAAADALEERAATWIARPA
jgi:4-diphosphocytidyl-2-C-methyl-D-erythritol kinase